MSIELIQDDILTPSLRKQVKAFLLNQEQLKDYDASDRRAKYLNALIYRQYEIGLCSRDQMQELTIAVDAQRDNYRYGAEA